MAETFDQAPAPESTDLPPDFLPPFPDRDQLFATSTQTPAERSTQPNAQSAVQLKGFANRGELRALVMIDGRIKAMRVGEACQQIEIVAIEPPRVTLREADRIWSETLLPPQNRYSRQN
jgi:hypothetical protein